MLICHLRRFSVGGVLAAASALLLAGCVSPPVEFTVPECGSAQLTVLPHPDDERQSWALREQLDCPINVAVVLTLGEQSNYCDVNPYANGKYSSECEELRLKSWRSFYSAMTGAEFPETPMVAAGIVAPSEYGRVDGERSVESKMPRVWHDTELAETLIAFDLGDGDLTKDEVVWALQQIITSPERFSLAAGLSFDAILGSYYYDGGDASCFRYEHPDHLSVQDALHGDVFTDTFRYGPTCHSAIRDTIVSASVSAGGKAAAWGEGGAFKHSYGWLGGWMRLADGSEQDELFHSYQTFWVRPATTD